MLQRTAYEGRTVRRLYYAVSSTEATELLKLYQEGTLIYDIANNQVQNWRSSTSLESYSYQEYEQTGTTEETSSGSASGSASTSSAASSAASAAPSAPAGWSIRNVSTSVSPGATEEETNSGSASGSASSESAAQSAANNAPSAPAGWSYRNVSTSVSPITGTQFGRSTGSSTVSAAAATAAAIAGVPSGAVITGGSDNYSSATMTWTSSRTYSFQAITGYSWSASWTEFRTVVTSYNWSATWTEYRTVAVFGYVTYHGTRTNYVVQWDTLPEGTLFTQYRIERDGGSDVIISNLATTSYNFGTTNYRARIRAENPGLGIESVWTEYVQN